MKNTTAIILLVLSVALFYAFTHGQYQKTKELAVVAEGYSNVLEDLSKIAETRDRLLIEYEGIPKAEAERLEKILPDNVDTVELALDLDAIASAHGISIKDVRIDTAAVQNANQPVLPEFGKPYEKTIITFSFVSNYQNFRLFLSDLEKSLRLMDVKAVSFLPNDAGLYEHKVSVETRWLGSRTPGLAEASAEELIKLAEELSSISFDQKLFSTQVYRFLNDFSSPLVSQPAGRRNPFDIIGRD